MYYYIRPHILEVTHSYIITSISGYISHKLYMPIILTIVCPDSVTVSPGLGQKYTHL